MGKSHVLEPGQDISCHEQCMKMFCANEVHGRHQTHADSTRCGAKDGFDACSSCCDSVKDGQGWGNCHSGHRRLSEAGAANEASEATSQDDATADTASVLAGASSNVISSVENVVYSEADDMHYTEAECAAECLSTVGCFAFDLKDGVCTISDECDGDGEESDGFKTGKWFVRKGKNKEDLNVKTPKKKKSKKRRKKKGAKKV